jgi:hypothetical protein
MAKPWTICPDCGVGKGSDHLKTCSLFAGNRGAVHPNYSVKDVLDQFDDLIDNPPGPAPVMPVVREPLEVEVYDMCGECDLIKRVEPFVSPYDRHGHLVQPLEKDK